MERTSMKKAAIKCPHCNKDIEVPKPPFLTVDIIIELEKGIVLIKRKYPPIAWALPGGYVDYGESLEDAAIREAKEETSLDVVLKRQLHTYSDPRRDLRSHNVTTVYIATAEGKPKADDDAKEVGVFTKETLPGDLAFDHAQVLQDYFQLLAFKI
jgi:ADP-ribose pyrophosphatase YjhB (NUDIX family)